MSWSLITSAAWTGKIVLVLLQIRSELRVQGNLEAERKEEEKRQEKARKREEARLAAEREAAAEAAKAEAARLKVGIAQHILHGPRPLNDSMATGLAEQALEWLSFKRRKRCLFMFPLLHMS